MNKIFYDFMVMRETLQTIAAKHQVSVEEVVKVIRKEWGGL